MRRYLICVLQIPNCDSERFFITFASVMEKRRIENTLLTALFDQYRESFILFANSYVRDIAAAEDIYMEAITQYWEKRNELPADINVPAYILTSVKNKALNYLRHQNVRSDVENQIYNHRLRELNFRISSLESCEPSDLFASEVKQIVRDTLKELPSKTRTIFFKSRYENKTNKEIASELNISIKTVEFHISKSLHLFRLRLQDYLPLLLVLFHK